MYGQPGTWLKGRKVLTNFMNDTLGFGAEGYKIVDGSGVSRYNLLSPHHVVMLLRWLLLHLDTNSRFSSLLPAPGQEGALKQRMIIDDVPLKVQAKTGTMTGISSLCGFVTTQANEQLAFAIMINNFIRPALDYKRLLEDQLCSFFANAHS